MSSPILSWLRRHWAIVLAGLLVLFVAGGASMARFARVPSPAPLPPVSLPPPER
ncbi:MAG TPA: hypothetical protein VKH41_15690 [Myxococcota bacterium]|nr:hypothetical protein [Myxococcota bacterium]